MGFVEDPYQVLSFQMAASLGDAEVDRRLQQARSWAGLTSQGRILISIEPRGFDIQTLVDHETIHDGLMRASEFGWLQIVLAGMALPPFPPGTTQRRARRLLATSMQASVRVQEACATFLPSLDRQGEDLTAYWAAAPPQYRKVSESLEWLRTREVDPSNVRHLVYGVAQVALCPPLGADWTARGLSDPEAWAAYLSEVTINPNDRFETLARSLAGASDEELTQLALTDDWHSMLAALDEHWYPRLANKRAPYRPMPRDKEGHRRLVLELVEAIVTPWAEDPEISSDEAELLSAARTGNFIPPIGEALLNIAFTRTVSERGAIWDNPPLERILPYELAELSVNPAPHPIPGIEATSGKSLRLSMGEAAVWLRSPRLPAAACRLSAPAVVEYLNRVDTNRTTLCVEDGGYLFLFQGVVPAPEVLRGRPHIVLVTNRAPHALLMDVLVQWDSIGTYCIVDSDLPGASYLLMRPENSPYPIVVMPLPAVSAQRAAQVLKRGIRLDPWPNAPDLVSFVERDPFAATHVRRTIAMYEDKPWPEGERMELSTVDARTVPPPGGDLSDLDRLIELNRMLAWIDHDRAVEYEQAGRHHEALEKFTRAHQRDPTDPYVLVNRGAVFEGLDRYDEAISDYDNAIQLDPSLAIAYLNRGNTYGLLGRSEDAVRDYTAAIARDSMLKQAYLHRAETFGFLGRLGEAIADFNHLIELDPDNAAAYSGRGLAYSESHDYGKALEDLIHAIGLDPSNADAYLRRGRVYERLKNTQRAIADYTEAIRLQPDMHIAYDFRGSIYGQQGNYEPALADFNKAVELAPDDAGLHYKRGMSHIGVNNLEAAMADFRRAIQLDPSHAEAHFNIGVLLYNEGAANAALPYFEKAKVLGDPHADASLERIKRELT
jgi:tetratricopeptide (TPR) repeat protein